MKNDNDQFFRIIKHVLSAYQNLNTIFENLQQDLSLIIVDKNQFETRIKIQKQKIQNIIKKNETRQHE